MRSENPVHFKNFSEKLKKAFKDRGSNQLSNIDWFQLTFENIFENATQHLSWRSLINTFNCIIIIKNACNTDLTESEKNELKSRMKDIIVKFIKRRFRRFIENSGDWEGLKKYESATRYPDQKLVDTYLVTYALAILAGVLGATAIFRRS